MNYYYIIEGRNGWCGCDEDFYLKTSYSPVLIDNYFEEILASYYNFFTGDDRFYDDDDLSEEEQEEAYYEEVMSNSSIEEISEEEYLEAVENGENIIKYGK